MPLAMNVGINGHSTNHASAIWLPVKTRHADRYTSIRQKQRQVLWSEFIGVTGIIDAKMAARLPKNGAANAMIVLPVGGEA